MQLTGIIQSKHVQLFMFMFLNKIVTLKENSPVLDKMAQARSSHSLLHYMAFGQWWFKMNSPSKILICHSILCKNPNVKWANELTKSGHVWHSAKSWHMTNTDTPDFKISSPREVTLISTGDNKINKCSIMRKTAIKSTSWHKHLVRKDRAGMETNRSIVL